METIPEDFEAFLAEPRNAVLCISRGDGRAPHATPVWFHYADGRFQVSITRTRVKYRLLQQAPEVALVVDDALGTRTIVVEGRAAITDDDASLLALARTLRAKYGGHTPRSDAEVLRALRAEERVVVTIPAERVLSWAE